MPYYSDGDNGVDQKRKRDSDSCHRRAKRKHPLVERRRGDEAERYQRHGSSASKMTHWPPLFSNLASHISLYESTSSWSIGTEKWLVELLPLLHSGFSFASLLVPPQRQRPTRIPKRLSSATVRKRPGARPSVLSIEAATVSRRSRPFLAASAVPLIRTASMYGTKGSGSASTASARRRAGTIPLLRSVTSNTNVRSTAATQLNAMEPSDKLNLRSASRSPWASWRTFCADM